VFRITLMHPGTLDKRYCQSADAQIVEVRSPNVDRERLKAFPCIAEWQAKGYAVQP
jgi:hypothetical protein